MVPFLLLLPSLATQCAPETCTGAAQPKCPTASGRVSKPNLGGHRENVYFRNVSPHPAEMSRVSGDGVEVSHGLLLPGMRRATSTVHGDVWRARAVTSGKANGRLLMEHQIGAVQIHACECPQPAFVDCSKAPTIRDGSVVSDPIVFENQAAEPVDLFYFNGTCEELVSWDEIGGVQPFNRKPMLSNQGHTFRLRSSADRRLLMAHTLDDVVIRGCSDDEAAARKPLPDGLAALRAETSFFEREHATLREALALEWSRLALALAGSNATASVPWAVASAGAPQPKWAAGVVSPVGAVLPALVSIGK